MSVFKGGRTDANIKLWLDGWRAGCAWTKQGRVTCHAARLDMKRNPRPYARGFVAAMREAGA